MIPNHSSTQAVYTSQIVNLQEAFEKTGGNGKFSKLFCVVACLNYGFGAWQVYAIPLLTVIPKLLCNYENSNDAVLPLPIEPLDEHHRNLLSQLP